MGHRVPVSALAAAVASLIVVAVSAGCGDGTTAGDDVITTDTVPDVAGDLAEPADGTEPGDTTEPRDTVESDGTVEPDVVSQPSIEGRILVSLGGWGGQYSSDAGVTIDFFDGPMRMDAFAAYSPTMYQVQARDGDCVLYAGSEAACTPVCNWDQFCDAANKCVDAPERISAGRVTLGAGATSTSVYPSTDEFMPNYYYADPIAAGLMKSENQFTVKADGAEGGFGAFNLATTGVDTVQFGIDQSANSLVLEDGLDNVVTWTTDPANAAGAFVEIVGNVGWHGSPPEMVLYCRKDAAAGSLTIPRAIVEAYPSTGGPSLEPHGSHIGLGRTVSAVVDGKTVEFTVARRHGLYLSHNEGE